MTSVIGCVSCGKPALLVDDEAPKAFPACFWCLTERRPGASKLFLDEVRLAERERCANVCERMVVGGRAWNAEQQAAAEVLFAAAKNIREGK